MNGFDPISAYPAYDGMTPMSSEEHRIQMDAISNLIADMGIQHATPEETLRVVRHFMVVADAEKHNLDWKQSAVDHGIAQLTTKYEGTSNDGSQRSK
jgi:hypothetical protein